MKKIFYLSNCSTCKQALKNLGEKVQNFELQDIKKQHINAEELDAIAHEVGTYEALFSRRSQQYRLRGLHEQALTEADYRRLMLEEYTFLKRPLIVDEGNISAGGKVLKG
jgi:arsenate reductase